MCDQVLFAADLRRFGERRADGGSPVKVKRLRAKDLISTAPPSPDAPTAGTDSAVAMHP
jgi:hypothetical protein